MMNEIDKSKAYRTIANHIYIAYPRYSCGGNEIMILADNIDEAKEKASKFYDLNLITVKKLFPTEDPQIYRI